ncbi:unnamed protein product [Polarella glacialis]|uniref:VDE lipocalin domain-containing protein n=1 Tax=Polarella glacialis TaxID=89957 RepID=A0A813I980_POLGL|nr:unnamed protein product [Polarella glacialis]CAE8646869.1 unnamed protein product [Polarella glacialis]
MAGLMPRLLSPLLLVASLAATVAQNPASSGICVMSKCGSELAGCLMDSVCRSWVSCTPLCGPANLECQIRCGDVYKPTDASSAKIDEFSECIISKNHCVPQQKLNCAIPANAKAYATRFDSASMKGTWYITRGWNPLFDCFDCQVHTFTFEPTAAKPLVGDLKYSVKSDLSCTSNCAYLPREVHQSFSQDSGNSGHLENHNNTLEEMHYSDDWYVLAARSDTYALIYYCGCNDAACGYSGAVLYMRSPHFKDLAAEDVEAIRKAAAAAHVEGFNLDGMCSPEPLSCGAQVSEVPPPGAAVVHI